MNRRTFFTLAPLGLCSMAALASADQSAPRMATDVTVAVNGKTYHPLVVAADDTTYGELPV